MKKAIDAKELCWFNPDFVSLIHRFLRPVAVEGFAVQRYRFLAKHSPRQFANRNHCGEGMWRNCQLHTAGRYL